MAIIEKIDEYLELGIDDLTGPGWQSFKLFEPAEGTRSLTAVPFQPGDEGPERAVVSSLSFHDQELLLRFTKLHPHSQQYFVWKIVDLLIERNKEEMRLIVPWSEKRTRTIRIRIATIGDSISVDFQLMP